MHTRSMTTADVVGALQLWRACEGVGLSEGDTPEGLEAFLTRNPGLSTVALADERLIGALLVGHDGRRGHLYHLAVDAEFRGRGLGRALVERATEALRGVGVTKCHVMVFRDNVSGREFWDHLGWRRREELDVYTLVADASPTSDGSANEAPPGAR